MYGLFKNLMKRICRDPPSIRLGLRWTYVINSFSQKIFWCKSFLHFFLLTAWQWRIHEITLYNEEKSERWILKSLIIVLYYYVIECTILLPISINISLYVWVFKVILKRRFSCLRRIPYSSKCALCIHYYAHTRSNTFSSFS